METMQMQYEISELTEFLFDEEIHLTGITEYGIGWEDLTKSRIEIPKQGARFDLEFERKVSGEKINGSIKGLDYHEVRADGKFMLNIHAIIVTDDGETIAVKETGLSTPDSSGKARLHLNMDFYTTAKKYDWINKK